MRELRTSAEGKLRVLFAWDPRRQVILLLGGDKTGKWTVWYRKNIPKADDRYDAYLSQIQQELTGGGEY